MKRKVILAGKLGKIFGREHEFDISTPAEAIRALSVNFKDFASHLIDSEKNNIGYRVVVDKQPIDSVENIRDPFSQTVRIVPVVIGAKGGLGSIILGVALIAVSFIPGLNVAVWSGMAATWSSIAFSLGTSLLLGGVAQLLSPQQKSQAPAEAPENKPSYTFDGPVNTTSQGQPVPLGYGRLIVGSAVISAGITADEYGAAGVS
jgi:predicted phage tail protein